MTIVLHDRAPLIVQADLVLLEGESVGPFLGEAEEAITGQEGNTLTVNPSTCILTEFAFMGGKLNHKRKRFEPRSENCW